MCRHGSGHDVYKHPSKPGRIVVARHRTLSLGVARVIARVARLARLAKEPRQ